MSTGEVKPAVAVFGSDPEGFITHNGDVIGSEKCISEHGIQTACGRVVRDGVQFELHPEPGMIGTHRRNTGFLLNTLFRFAAAKGFGIGFDGLYDVPRAELDSLSPDTRVLGCQPSLNVYDAKPISVDATTYTKRSAGGHIHLGLAGYVKNTRRRLVPLLDILVGNTCVLLDRDPGAAERRENYGRAGEFRTPRYGLEYRTPSNFWLRDPVLMDFVFGLTHFAVSIFYAANNKNTDPWNHISENSDIESVRLAIDTNNFDLAMENFKEIESAFWKYSNEDYVLHSKNIAAFMKLAHGVQKDGIEDYFPRMDILKRWNAQEYEPFTHMLKRVL